MWVHLRRQTSVDVVHQHRLLAVNCAQLWGSGCGWSLQLVLWQQAILAGALTSLFSSIVAFVLLLLLPTTKKYDNVEFAYTGFIYKVMQLTIQ